MRRIQTPGERHDVSEPSGSSPIPPQERVGERRPFGRPAQAFIGGPLMLLIWLLSVPLVAQQPANEEAGASFRLVDIYVDSKGAPLAAYQIRFSVTNANARIVGIEGGEHPAFREPPVYDPQAMQHERVIIAAFNTAVKDELPNGKTRVATIHLQITGDDALQCVSKVQTAANPEGTKIAVEATWEERKHK